MRIIKKKMYPRGPRLSLRLRKQRAVMML